MNEKVVSPNSSLFDLFPLSLKIKIDDGGSYSDRISSKDPDQGYVKVEFAAPTPPSIPEVEAYASNESFMSDYCMFTQVVLYLPPIEGVHLDFDLGIEHDPSDEVHYRFFLYANNKLWCHLLIKKDLQPQ